MKNKIIKGCLLGLFWVIFSLNLYSSDMLSKGISLKDVTIYGKRPLKEIGVQKTSFDSTELKENISLAMGDVLTNNSTL